MLDMVREKDVKGMLVVQNLHLGVGGDDHAVRLAKNVLEKGLVRMLEGLKVRVHPRLARLVDVKRNPETFVEKLDGGEMVGPDRLDHDRPPSVIIDRQKERRKPFPIVMLDQILQKKNVGVACEPADDVDHGEITLIEFHHIQNTGLDQFDGAERLAVLDSQKQRGLFVGGAHHVYGAFMFQEHTHALHIT
jgi:hypothetical protein